MRALNAPIVDFSDEMRRNDRRSQGFLFERMYRHYRVNRMSSNARRVVHDLFALYLAEPHACRANGVISLPARTNRGPRGSRPTTSPG